MNRQWWLISQMTWGLKKNYHNFNGLENKLIEDEEKFDEDWNFAPNEKHVPFIEPRLLFKRY